MPCILEGFKLGERTGVSYSRVAMFVIFAAVIGTLLGFWAHLDMTFRHGGWGKLWPAYETFNRLSRWLTAPVGGNVGYVSAFSFGTLFVILLSVVRGYEAVALAVVEPLHRAGDPHCSCS